jgi:hypothetical protein
LWAVQVCKGKEQSLGTPIAARHQSHDGSVGLGTGTLEPSLKHGIRQKGQVIAPIVSGAAQSFGGIANGRQLFRHNSVRYLACFLVPLKPIHSLGYQGTRNCDSCADLEVVFEARFAVDNREKRCKLLSILSLQLLRLTQDSQTMVGERNNCLGSGL